MQSQEENKDLFGVVVPPEVGKKINNKAVQLHAKLINLHGKTEDKKCKTCALLGVRSFAKNYYKCTLVSSSGNPATDWRVNWQACGKYQPETEEK